MRKHLDEGWAVDGVISAAVERAWAPGGATRVGVACAWEEGGATRLASERNWAPGGVLDEMIQKLWAPGGALRLMVEDRDSAWWAGLARAQARRAEATEARWAEQRKAHAASGRTGNFARYGTDFAGVQGNYDRFEMSESRSTGHLSVSYNDLHVAALAYDITRVARGRAPRNFPNRVFCLAASPSKDELDVLMRQAAGGGHGIQVVVKDSAEKVRVRYVLERTLALEMATDRRAFGRRLVEEARKRGGVVRNDDLFDELMARVDAADYEVLLGDRLRAEGFAEPRRDGRAAPRKKRRRAASDDDAVLPAPAGQWRSRAERAAKRVKPDA